MDKKTFTHLIILNLFTSCHCTITQIALSVALSYIFSNSILIFSFFTGLYLMSMGMGTLLIEKINYDSKRLINLLFYNSLFGILLASPGIILVILLNEYLHVILRNNQIDLLFIMFPLGIFLTILIGIVSGAELPIFSKLIEKEKLHISKPIISVLSSDYFGAFIGIFAFTFILNPFLGLINAITFSQTITLVFITWAYLSLNAEKIRSKIFFTIIAINIYVLIIFLTRNYIINFIDAISAF